MIRAICFDLDGVYFKEDSFNKFKNSILKLCDKKDIVDDVFHGEMMNSFKKGHITEDNYWNYVKKSLNIAIANNEIFKILRDSYEVNYETIKIIKNVKKLGIKTCICSNNFITRIRELNIKFNFLEMFDTKIFSFEHGYLKPQKEIFQELIHCCQLLPNEILYSDDNSKKLTGARDLGITTYVYNSTDLFIRELEKHNITTSTK